MFSTNPSKHDVVHYMHVAHVHNYHHALSTNKRSNKRIRYEAHYISATPSLLSQRKC